MRCTLIGCSDEVSIIVRRADGLPSSLASEIKADGQTIACAAPAEYEPLSFCGAKVMISQTEVQDCHDTHQFEQRISVHGRPKRVEVILKDGSRVIAQRTFEPSYQPVFPNGVACGAVCSQAVERWTLS